MKKKDLELVEVYKGLRIYKVHRDDVEDELELEEKETKKGIASNTEATKTATVPTSSKLGKLSY